MKNLITFSLIASSLALIPVSSFAEYSSRASIDAVVVTEQVSGQAPVQDQGRTAAVYDGGYIDAGDPIAGDRAPSAAEVGQAVRSALQADGFRPTEHGVSPDLLIVYHWGVIRQGRGGRAGVSSLDNLYRARLYLTAPARVANDIESSVNRHQTVNWTAERQEAFQLAHDDRYFVIVSAYDYAALDKSQRVLLWQTRISSRATGPSMQEILPSLIAAGSDYFGRNSDTAIDRQVSLVNVSARDAVTPFPSRPEVATSTTDKTIRQIIDQETREFSGGPLASNR